jgi:hypothetical protein
VKLQPPSLHNCVKQSESVLWVNGAYWQRVPIMDMMKRNHSSGVGDAEN